MDGIALIRPRALAPRELGWLGSVSAASWYRLLQPVAAARTEPWGRSRRLVSADQGIRRTDWRPPQLSFLGQRTQKSGHTGLRVRAAASPAHQPPTGPNSVWLEQLHQAGPVREQGPGLLPAAEVQGPSQWAWLPGSQLLPVGLLPHTVGRRVAGTRGPVRTQLCPGPVPSPQHCSRKDPRAEGRRRKTGRVCHLGERGYEAWEGGCWGLRRVLLGQEKLEHVQRLGGKRKSLETLELSNMRWLAGQTNEWTDNGGGGVESGQREVSLPGAETAEPGRDSGEPGGPPPTKKNEHLSFRGWSWGRGCSDPFSLPGCGGAWPSVPGSPRPSSWSLWPFLEPPPFPTWSHIDPLPPGGGRVGSRQGFLAFRVQALSRLQQIPRHDKLSSSPVPGAKGPHPGLAFSHPDMPNQSPWALPPWSLVKVPSLHDTDMWGVLLFQARPPPTGWATPIAVTITGQEAGGQLLL